MQKRVLVKNIGQLVQVREKRELLRGSGLEEVPVLEDAWLCIEDGRVADYGSMKEFPGISDWNNLEVMDADGCTVMPAFVDCHTHIVFAVDRKEEYVMRLKGITYEEIAMAGGGILNSARKLQELSEDELFERASHRLRWMMEHGTGAVEIKSGYGLTLESELKMLRVVQRLRNFFSIPVKATLLAAHAIPERYRGNKDGYVKEIISEIIPAVAQEKLADFIDVFCENGYFTPEDAERIFTVGLKYGLIPKVHAEQMSHSGGIQVGVRCGAISVDHLEYATQEDITLLRNSDTIPVLLPGAQLFLGLKNPPVQQMLIAGLPIALASDFNPGSSPGGNMGLMMALGSMMYKLVPEVCLNAVTVNAAFAMGVHHQCGSVFRGAKANLLMLKKGFTYHSFCYHYGMNIIEKIIPS